MNEVSDNHKGESITTGALCPTLRELVRVWVGCRAGSLVFYLLGFGVSGSGSEFLGTSSV